MLLWVLWMMKHVYEGDDGCPGTLPIALSLTISSASRQRPHRQPFSQHQRNVSLQHSHHRPSVPRTTGKPVPVQPQPPHIYLIASPQVASIPAESSKAINELEPSDGPNLPIVNTIQWMGPAFPTGPKITLSGTPESIYKQLLKINPKYDAWDMPGNAENAAKRGVTRDGTTNATKALETRQFREVRCTVQR